MSTIEPTWKCEHATDKRSDGYIRGDKVLQGGRPAVAKICKAGWTREEVQRHVNLIENALDTTEALAAFGRAAMAGYFDPECPSERRREIFNLFLADKPLVMAGRAISILSDE